MTEGTLCYCNKKIDDMTREELIEAVKYSYAMYRELMERHDHQLEVLPSLRRAGRLGGAR